nr:MAG TPA: hypothetical protein [Caudoviricetes sp.]
MIMSSYRPFLTTSASRDHSISYLLAQGSKHLFASVSKLCTFQIRVLCGLHVYDFSDSHKSYINTANHYTDRKHLINDERRFSRCYPDWFHQSH